MCRGKGREGVGRANFGKWRNGWKERCKLSIELLSRFIEIPCFVRRYSALMINRKCVNRTDWGEGGIVRYEERRCEKKRIKWKHETRLSTRKSDPVHLSRNKRQRDECRRGHCFTGIKSNCPYKSWLFETRSGATSSSLEILKGSRPRCVSAFVTRPAFLRFFK